MQHRNWKSILQQASASPDELLSELDIEDSSLISLQANQDFPLRVPAGFISKMSKNDPADPLFKQIWPSAEEEIDQTGFSKDPLNEVKRQAAPGLLHKYHGRVLLVLTGACAAKGHRIPAKRDVCD